MALKLGLSIITTRLLALFGVDPKFKRNACAKYEMNIFAMEHAIMEMYNLAKDRKPSRDTFLGRRIYFALFFCCRSLVADEY